MEVEEVKKKNPEIIVDVCEYKIKHHFGSGGVVSKGLLVDVEDKSSIFLHQINDYKGRIENLVFFLSFLSLSTLLETQSRSIFRKNKEHWLMLNY